MNATVAISAYISPHLRPGRGGLHQQGPCEARLGYQDESPQLALDLKRVYEAAFLERACRSGKLLSERRLGCRDRLPSKRGPLLESVVNGRKQREWRKQRECAQIMG